MIKWRFLPVLFATVAVSSAAAAEDFIAGVYAQSEELCAQAKREGLQPVLDAGNVVLTARGIEGTEYQCEFMSVAKASRSTGWLVSALCEEPGYAFPDMLSVMPRSTGQLELVSVRVADPDDPAGNGGMFYLCDGVKMP